MKILHNYFSSSRFSFFVRKHFYSIYYKSGMIMSAPNLPYNNCRLDHDHSPHLPKVKPTSDEVNHINSTTSIVPTNFKDSFYKRPLPSHLIPFNSPVGRTIFNEALALGGLESFFPLIEQFHTQNEPAFCGLGTLTMVLNTFNIDPNRSWKYPWRYFSEETLDLCIPLDEIQKEGTTFDEFSCFAKRNGVDCQDFRASQSSVAEFKEKIIMANESVKVATDPIYVVVAFHRKSLGQTGIGHYSPIGGIHPDKNLVLILDTARFKYPPYWVPIELMFESMLPIDSVTEKSRGYFLMKRNSRSCSSLCHITKFEWKLVLFELSHDIIKKRQEVIHIREYFEILARNMELVENIAPKFDDSSICLQHSSLLDRLYEELKLTQLYSLLKSLDILNHRKIVQLLLFFFSTSDAVITSKLPNTLAEELMNFKKKHWEIEKLIDKINNLSNDSFIMMATTRCASCHSKQQLPSTSSSSSSSNSGDNNNNNHNNSHK